MIGIDNLLIEKLFSPFAGWLRDRLGIGQWRAALQCLDGSLVFYLGAVALELTGKGITDPIFITLLRALIWLLILDAVRRVACRQAASSVGVHTARAREWIFRAILVIALPFSAARAESFHGVLYSASLLLLIAHLYLKAADIPPPAIRGRFAYSRA